jgi:hypothetical protein
MASSDDYFADAIRLSPLEGLDEELERCLRHISFAFALVFLCCYTHADRSIVSTGPRTVEESTYKKGGRVGARLKMWSSSYWCNPRLKKSLSSRRPMSILSVRRRM